MIKNDSYDQRMAKLGNYMADVAFVPAFDLDAIAAEVNAVATIVASAGGQPLGTLATIRASLHAWTYQDDDAHDTCSLTACLNPLHPGPCKGWKGTLHSVAPHVWKGIEEERVKKANAKRVAKIAALKAEGKPIPKKLLTPIVAKPHPDAGKTANSAGGEAHDAGKAISQANGVVTNEPGKVTLGQAIKPVKVTDAQPGVKGPKGKKPTVASKGIATVISQEKVTPQYKLDKAAGITPEQWKALSGSEQDVIRGELAKIQKDGFGPQQKKATELLEKLDRKGPPDTGKAPAAQKGEPKPETPKAVTTQAQGGAPTPAKPEPVAEPVKTPKAVPAHIKAATDMAHGKALGASWLKNQLPAYQKLSAEDFGTLDKETQGKIMDALRKGETKFLDPKKIQATKDLIAKFKGADKPKGETKPEAPKAVSFSGDMHDHSVSAADAKKAVDAQPVSALAGLAAKIAGVGPDENPDSPKLQVKAVNGASDLADMLTHGYDMPMHGYSTPVLAQPGVKKALADFKDAALVELHAKYVADAKRKAYNKINQKLLADGFPMVTDKLSPIEKAGLQKYQKYLLDHPVKTDIADLDALTAQTTAAKNALTTELQAALKKASAPKPENMTTAQLADRIHDLLSTVGQDATLPSLGLTADESNSAKGLAKEAAKQEGEKYDADTLADPLVAAKQVAVQQAAEQYMTASYAQLHLNKHLSTHHDKALASGVDVDGKALTADDKKIIQLHKDKLLAESPDVAGKLAKLNEAKKAFHDAAASASKPAPPEPVTLSDYDKTTVTTVYSNAWSKVANKAATYGVNTFGLTQKMKQHPQYASLTQDLGDLKALAGQVAAAHAEQQTAYLNVPTDPDTGYVMPTSPEWKAWQNKIHATQALQKQFTAKLGTAQKKLDTIRVDIGLKKRALPKLDADAVKAAAAEKAMFATGGYSGPNYGKPAAAKNYLAAKLGSQLGVPHMTAAEKKAAKTLGNAAAASPAAKIKNATVTPATPVNLDGGGTIDAIPDSLKKTITSDYKAMPTGKYLADPAEDVFDNLVNLAAAHGKNIPGGLSVDQVVKTIDATFAKQLGVTNSGLLEKKITDWLATGTGKAYAQSHSTPDPSVVKQLNGELDLPAGITLAPGEKVQKVSGPGPHDETLPASAFRPLSAIAAQESQAKYFKEQGIKVSAAQKKALTSYTGSAYHTYNSYLRGKGSATAAQKQDIVHIQSAMQPLQQHTLLRRGTGWDALPAEYQGYDNVQKLIGKTIEEPGFTSSTVAGESGNFGGALQLEIEAPIGTPAYFVKALSHFKSENEMLLAAGTKFKALSVTKVGSKTVLRVRIVGDK